MLLPPEGIAVRESSALRQGVGPLVARALVYLSEHLAEAPTVADLAQVCHASRRTVENAFRHDLRRSPGAELRRMKLERARHLLAETDLPLAAIAESCGFPNAPWFWTAFKRMYGATPHGCRKQSGL